MGATSSKPEPTSSKLEPTSSKLKEISSQLQTTSSNSVDKELLERINFMLDKRLTYSVPPKKPDPATGVILAVNPTEFVVEHLNGELNKIPNNVFYDYDQTRPLTIKPKDVNEGKLDYKVGQLVRYSLEDAEPKPAIGEITKIEPNKKKPSELVLTVKHLDGDKIIFSSLHTLSNKVGPKTSLTKEPVRFGHLPFKKGMFITYSVTNAEPMPATGKIIDITHNKDNHHELLYVIQHNNGEVKHIPTSHPNIKMAVNKEITDLPLKIMEIKPSDGRPSFKLKIKDNVVFPLESSPETKGKILEFNYAARPPKIKVKLDDGKEVNIDSTLKGLTKAVEGKKKYTLKNENKYYLKYAEYKMKYLSLKNN